MMVGVSECVCVCVSVVSVGQVWQVCRSVRVRVRMMVGVSDCVCVCLLLALAKFGKSAGQLG